MTVSVRELKRRLSHYLTRAASGEAVTVTSRGRPVARLMAAPPETKKELNPAEIRRRLAAIPGVIMGEPGRIKGARHPIRIRKGETTLSEIVLEGRR
jgi:prevent-host-death family protein